MVQTLWPRHTRKLVRSLDVWEAQMYLTNKNAAGSPFTVNGMGDKILLVPSREHIKDISFAPGDHLSFHAFQNAVRNSLADLEGQPTPNYEN